MLGRLGLREKDLVSHVQQQIDLMRLVDAHLRPAVQIDSKTIEAYYREKFVPQLKQSGAGDVPLADVSAKIRELLTQEKVNELMVSWLQSLRSESKVSVPGSARVSRRGSAVAVTEPAARPRRWWKYLLMATGVVVVAVLAALWYINHQFLPGLRAPAHGRGSGAHYGRPS